MWPELLVPGEVGLSILMEVFQPRGGGEGGGTLYGTSEWTRGLCVDDPSGAETQGQGPFWSLTPKTAAILTA